MQSMTGIDNVRSTSRNPESVTAALFRFIAGQPGEMDKRAARVASWDRDTRAREWVVLSGCGALLCMAVDAGEVDVPQSWRQELLAADLTARVRHQIRMETVHEVLERCHILGIESTLLKGIATAHTCYPAPHVRPMGDIDVLVPPDMAPILECDLMSRGFAQAHGDPIIHHRPPLQDTRRGVWVEIHTDLFREGSPSLQGNAFSRASVAAERRAWKLGKRACNLLSTEFHVTYSATSWIDDMIRSSIEPMFVWSLLDVLCLLRSHSAAIDWDRLIDVCAGSMARAATLVALTYLSRRGWTDVPPWVLMRLMHSQKVVGGLQVQAIHAALNRSLFADRRWEFPFPLPVPGRYGPRYQFEKRVLGTLFSRQQHNSAA